MLFPMPTSKSQPLWTLACLIILIWGLSEGRAFLLPLFISGFLAFLIAPLHHFLMKKGKLPDVVAVVVSAIIFLSPTVLFIMLLIRQGKGLVQDAPGLVAIAQIKFQDFTAHNPLAQKFGLEPNSDLASLIQELSSSFGKGVGFLVGGFAAVADIGSQMILIFVFSILFLASRTHLRRSMENLLAQNSDFNASHLLDQATCLVQQFLLARMTIVVIIGTMATLALTLLNVKYSIFLGTLFGLLTLVPAIGSLFAIGTAAITASVTGHPLGAVLLIILVLLGISLLENYYLSPKMIGNRLHLNALTCFVGLFAGGLLWGIWGMFLSVPILGVMRIVFSAIPSLEVWGEFLADQNKTKSK